MKQIFREVSLLVILPLVLMSMSLAVIGTSHTTKIMQTNRIMKIREFEDVSIHCSDDLCQDFDSFENT